MEKKTKIGKYLYKLYISQHSRLRSAASLKTATVILFIFKIAELKST